ncbi:MAG: zf-HC2 domain-containing protein [Acidobacteria bacterium]|nr:zf-HC2 domain-containing protein [Acidobacteriota bacterium]
MHAGEHISDQDLILYVDAELPALRRIAVSRHLDACAQCRAQHAQLREAMTGLTAAILSSEPVEGGAAAQHRLRTRLAAAPKTPSFQLHMARLSAAVAIALALIGASVALQTRNAEQSGLTMPNPVLTPGAAVPVSRETVCSASEAEESPKIATALAITVFNHYGIRNPQSQAYEVDYLITPSLGGSQDVRNLWPQPYSSGLWNSRVKDALEDRLRAMVCAGQLDLEQAQKELASDWIAAYKRHFHTDEPLPAHRSFVKDRAWE